MTILSLAWPLHEHFNKSSAQVGFFKQKSDFSYAASTLQMDLLSEGM